MRPRSHAVSPVPRFVLPGGGPAIKRTVIGNEFDNNLRIETYPVPCKVRCSFEACRGHDRSQVDHANDAQGDSPTCRRSSPRARFLVAWMYVYEVWQ